MKIWHIISYFYFEEKNLTLMLSNFLVQTLQIRISFWKSERNLVKKFHCVPHITPPGTKSPINLLSQTHRQKSSESLEMHCKSWGKQSNGILFQKLFWPSVRKICSCDQEELLKFYAEGREFTKILRSLEQFIWIVKGQYNFWNRMLFEVVPGGFLDQL